MNKCNCHIPPQFVFVLFNWFPMFFFPQHLVEGLLNFRRRVCRSFWLDLAFQDPPGKTDPCYRYFFFGPPRKDLWLNLEKQFRGPDFRYTNFPQRKDLPLSSPQRKDLWLNLKKQFRGPDFRYTNFPPRKDLPLSSPQRKDLWLNLKKQFRGPDFRYINLLPRQEL